MKPNKQASVDRKKQINAATQPKPDKRQTSRKVHDTKGKNTHARKY
jgi:hypothetical protein